MVELAAIKNPLLPMALGITDTVEIGDYKIHVGSAEADQVGDITMYAPSDEGGTRLVRAKKGRLAITREGREVRFDLSHGTLTNLRRRPTASDEISFDRLQIVMYRRGGLRQGLER